MTCNNVAEIYAFMDHARARLTRRVLDLSLSQQRFKTQPNCWCAGEIIEHLALVEERLSRMIVASVKRAQGVKRSELTFFAPVTLDRFVETVKAKLEAPELLKPSGAVEISESLAQLKSSRAKLIDLQPSVEELDLSSVALPHPIFGPLNIYEWLYFIGAHEIRHLKQIEALTCSPDFPQ